MKKILFFFIIVLFSSFVMAQSTFTLGPIAGINFAKVTTDFPDYTPKSILGYQGGGFLRISMERLYVQPELLFVYKSSEFTNPIDSNYSNSPESKYTFTFNYMEIPIILGLKIIDLDKLNVRAFTGPVISFALSNDVTTKLNGEDPSILNVQQYNITKDDFKKSLFAINFGAGADIGAFTFDIRYDIGINHIAINKVIFEKLNTFSFSVGVKIFN